MKNSDEPISKRAIQQQVWQAYRWNLAVVSVVSIIVGMVIGVFGIAPGPSPTADPLTPPSDWEAGYLPAENDPASSSVNALSVYVSGAVLAPQVVTLTAGSLVVDALEAVGGPTSDADLEAINLAAPLANHQQILIPRRITRTQRAQRANTSFTESSIPVEGAQQTENEEPLATDNTMQNEKVNINTATAEALEQLPRIGPKLAARIIAYREENGGFISVQDIQNVSGIGESTFAYLEPYITVGP